MCNPQAASARRDTSSCHDRSVENITDRRLVYRALTGSNGKTRFAADARATRFMSASRRGAEAGGYAGSNDAAASRYFRRLAILSLAPGLRLLEGGSGTSSRSEISRAIANWTYL